MTSIERTPHGWEPGFLELRWRGRTPGIRSSLGTSSEIGRHFAHTNASRGYLVSVNWQKTITSVNLINQLSDWRLKEDLTGSAGNRWITLPHIGTGAPWGKRWNSERCCAKRTQSFTMTSRLVPSGQTRRTDCSCDRKMLSTVNAADLGASSPRHRTGRIGHEVRHRGRRPAFHRMTSSGIAIVRSPPVRVLNRMNRSAAADGQVFQGFSGKWGNRKCSS